MARIEQSVLTRTITADALAHPDDLAAQLAHRHAVSRGTMSRHLKRLALGLYASKNYVKKHGLPQPGTALAGHDVVIYQRAIYASQIDAICGESTANARVAMEVSSGLMLMEAVVAGLGIGELPTYMADTVPHLVRLWPERAEPYDMWLVLHSDLNRTARVRAVADAIVAAYDRLEAP